MLWSTTSVLSACRQRAHQLSQLDELLIAKGPRAYRLAPVGPRHRQHHRARRPTLATQQQTRHLVVALEQHPQPLTDQWMKRMSDREERFRILTQTARPRSLRGPSAHRAPWYPRHGASVSPLPSPEAGSNYRPTCDSKSCTGSPADRSRSPPSSPCPHPAHPCWPSLADTPPRPPTWRSRTTSLLTSACPCSSSQTHSRLTHEQRHR